MHGPEHEPLPYIARLSKHTTREPDSQHESTKLSSTPSLHTLRLISILSASSLRLIRQLKRCLQGCSLRPKYLKRLRVLLLLPPLMTRRTHFLSHLIFLRRHSEQLCTTLRLVATGLSFLSLSFMPFLALSPRSPFPEGLAWLSRSSSSLWYSCSCSEADDWRYGNGSSFRCINCGKGGIWGFPRCSGGYADDGGGRDMMMWMEVYDGE